MCKCCQNCLESIWWNCCEERYCWDDSIVLYEEDSWNEKNGGMGGIENGGASVENLVVTRQPAPMQNNNHLQDQMYSSSQRDVLQELPIIAPNLYQVFSKSMIFRDDSKIPASFEDEKPAVATTDKSGHYKANIGKVVTFSDDKIESKPEKVEPIEDKLTDFQIMFQDELYGDHDMFKIEEEDEDEQSVEATDVSNSGKTKTDSFDDVVLRKDLKSPAPIEIVVQEATPEKAKEQTKASPSPKPVEGVNMRKHLIRAKSAHMLPRSNSSSSFGRSNSRQDLLRRVESMKEIKGENIKHVLSRLPETTVPFLVVPNLVDGSEISKKSSEELISSSASDQNIGRQPLISQMPDTPVIKGSKLPKFFIETPQIGEYKPETSLQSLKTSDIILTEFDYSMPRYYGKFNVNPKMHEPLHSSKSMPDLNVATKEKVNKRLVKLRGRLKPLVIKKNVGETSKSQSEIQRF